MDHTSGEILFHSKNLGEIGRKIYGDENIHEEFWRFIELKHNLEQGNENADREKTNMIGCKTINIYKLKLSHQSKMAWNFCDLKKKDILFRIDRLNNIFINELTSLQKMFDSRFMQLVLQYYVILRHEMEESRKQLFFERQDKNLAIQHALVLKEIQIFACHIKQESKSAVVLSTLGTETPQFERCAKAVKDNLPSDSFCRVFNVFKLTNSFLSKSLQVNHILSSLLTSSFITNQSNNRLHPRS